MIIYLTNETILRKSVPGDLFKMMSGTFESGLILDVLSAAEKKMVVNIKRIFLHSAAKIIMINIYWFAVRSLVIIYLSGTDI